MRRKFFGTVRPCGEVYGAGELGVEENCEAITNSRREDE